MRALARVLGLIRRWPLTTCALLSLAGTAIIAAHQHEAVRLLPDPVAGVIMVPAYALIIAAMLVTRVEWPWSLVVIVPAVLLLDHGCRSLWRRVREATAGRS